MAMFMMKAKKVALPLFPVNEHLLNAFWTFCCYTSLTKSSESPCRMEPLAAELFMNSQSSNKKLPFPENPITAPPLMALF